MSHYSTIFNTFCISLILEQRLAARDSAAPKQGDSLVLLIADFDRIQPAALSPMFLDRNGAKFVAQQCRPQEFHRA